MRRAEVGEKEFSNHKTNTMGSEADNTIDLASLWMLLNDAKASEELEQLIELRKSDVDDENEENAIVDLASMNETGVTSSSATTDKGVSNLRIAAVQEDDEDDDTCPFIYDKYEITYEVMGVEHKWTFDLNKLGFSHGYYCSLSLEPFTEQERLTYRFDNCSCPIGRYCNDDWGVATIELPFVGQRDLMIGKCTFYNWVFVGPVVIAFLFLCMCGCFCSRRARKREVIVVRAEPGHYVNLN